MFQRTTVTRREMLTSAALGLLSLPSLVSLACPSRRKAFEEPKRNPYHGSDDQLPDEIERAAFEFFGTKPAARPAKSGIVRCLRATTSGELPVLRRRTLDSAACASGNRVVTRGGGDPGSGAADASFSRAAIAQRARLLLLLHRYRNRGAGLELRTLLDRHLASALRRADGSPTFQ